LLLFVCLFVFGGFFLGEGGGVDETTEGQERREKMGQETGFTWWQAAGKIGEKLSNIVLLLANRKMEKQKGGRQ